MEETLKSCTAFMFADNISAADILSLLLLMGGCEKNRYETATEVLTIAENIIPRVIHGVKRKIHHSTEINFWSVYIRRR